MCQCPLTGSLHFYIDKKNNTFPLKGCQCPLTGSLHFYMQKDFHRYSTPEEVSMPLVGLSPFLLSQENTIIYNNFPVSMPFNGLTPFLQLEYVRAKQCTIKCQCPLTDSLHFYICEYLHVQPSEMCQCPLTGSLHFYGKDAEINDKSRIVSMPFNGLTPFLLV